MVPTIYCLNPPFIIFIPGLPLENGDAVLDTFSVLCIACISDYGSPPDIRSQAWRTGTAIGAGIAVVLALGFNRTQVIYTRGETQTSLMS